MAVYKSKDPFRVKPWCSDTYKGSKRKKTFFATKEEADEEEARQTLSPVSKKGWNKVKVSHLVERYRNEITPTKRGADSEKYRLNWLLKNEPGKTLCAYALSDLIERSQAWEYVRARQRQTSARGTKVTMRTISRERNLLQRVFQTAIEEWGYVGLTNPFRDLTLKGTKFKRQRRLIEETREYIKLMSACAKCRDDNKVYVPLAIDIAIETGMREEEIFNLNWSHINFNHRLIEIIESKTDEHQTNPGRTIPLPWRTMVRLALIKFSQEKSNGPVFPMTQSACIQSFEKAVIRAGIPSKAEDMKNGVPESKRGLEFRDLRTEANSRWDDLEPALTLTQRKTIMGHMGASAETNDVYSVSNLRRIREKLDRQSHNGETWEERYKDYISQGMSNIAIIEHLLDNPEKHAIDLLEFVTQDYKLSKIVSKERKQEATQKQDTIPSNVLPFKRADGA